MSSSITGPPPRLRRSVGRWGPIAFALAALGVLMLPANPRLLLANTTPSEPIGLYRRTGETPVPGRLAAFMAPPPAFPYADARLGYLHRVPLLKMIVGTAGDRICTLSGQLVINGRSRGNIARVDREGRALPQWRGCRRLGADELFVLSDRVSNSFDSRYFGPIPRRLVIGVYRPLLVLRGAH